MNTLVELKKALEAVLGKELKGNFSTIAELLNAFTAAYSRPTNKK